MWHCKPPCSTLLSAASLILPLHVSITTCDPFTLTFSVGAFPPPSIVLRACLITVFSLTLSLFLTCLTPDTSR
eukprot:CAMPEP_0169466562 /NCGR_PEP_ID=MMETSP1042-20121227/21840_1 /TAXON_ID=464988 /ORGANISM="Hemiselmis andersenii, Strain CCMP1180" /LENGTH=72 /DNA_ID=CAMNT_0009579635 /DNA_START=25 /DNA_END=240 /DNA_ORIENTATION=+